MITIEPCCGNCAWWHDEVPPLATAERKPAGSDPDVGSCMLMPPSVVLCAGVGMSLYPQTRRERGCESFTQAALDDPDGGEVVEPDNVVRIDRAA